jgi:hypothetical protein
MDDVDVDLAIATPKALVKIELDFKTAHHNETYISMVGIVNAWNFMMIRVESNKVKSLPGKSRGKSDCPVN